MLIPIPAAAFVASAFRVANRTSSPGMAPAAFFDVTCLSLFNQNLITNSSRPSTVPIDFHECVLPLPQLNTIYWKRWIIGAVFITFFVMLILSCACYQTGKTTMVDKLRVLDSYNLHREVEALWIKNEVHGKDALIKYHRGLDGTLPYKECPRYPSVAYHTDADKGRRKIIITEDLRRGPSEKDKKTWKRGLTSKIKAVQLQPGNQDEHATVQYGALDELGGEGRAQVAYAVGNDVEVGNILRAPEPTAEKMPGAWRESVWE